MSEIVSQSQPLLDNPGKIATSLYYTKLNSNVENIQCNFSTGRFRQNVTSPTFGGRAQLTIPSQSFLGECYLHLELPATVANQSLPRGWGFAAIRNISYTMGSSNTSQIEIRGQNMLQAIMVSAETSEKRNEIFRLAGEEIISAGVVPKADVLLALPWSNASGINIKKPFDSNTLSNPIIINIDFEIASRFYGGDGARPSQFSSAELVCRLGDLTDHSESLGTVLMQQPSMSLFYPFIHRNQATTGGPLVVADATQEQEVVLQGFLDSDLTTITFGVVLTSQARPSTNNSPSPFNYVDLQDVRLEFNGQDIVNLPGSLYKLECARSLPGAGYFHNSVISPGTVAPFNSEPKDTYVVTVDFGRIRSTVFENEFQNIKRFTSQSMVLYFKVPATGTYDVYATYYYNAIAQIQQGKSRIVFK